MTDTAKDMPELKPCANGFCLNGGSSNAQCRECCERSNTLEGTVKNVLMRMMAERQDNGWIYNWLLDAYTHRADLSRPQAPAEGDVAETAEQQFYRLHRSDFSDCATCGAAFKRGFVCHNCGNQSPHVSLSDREKYGYPPHKVIQAATRSSQTGAEGLVKALERDLMDAYRVLLSCDSDRKLLPDHACRECVPHGEMLIDGFRCVKHKALAAYRKQTGEA